MPEGTTPAFNLTDLGQGVFVHKGHHGEAAPWNGGDLANTGFIIGRDAVAVVDAGGSRAVAEALLAEIRARTDLPIGWLVLTHMHPDHTLGAKVFEEAGARIVGHANLPRAFSSRAEAYMTALSRDIGPGFAGPDAGFTIHPAPDSIDLGDRTQRLAAHPTAHTDNDLTLHDPLSEIWFLGDLPFVDHTPALDGSVLGWAHLMEHLGAPDADHPVRWAVPGHGPAAVTWPDASERQTADLTDLIASVRGAVTEGMDMLTAVETIGADRGEGWLLFESFHPRNVSAAFAELEW